MSASEPELRNYADWAAETTPAPAAPTSSPASAEAPFPAFEDDTIASIDSSVAKLLDEPEGDVLEGSSEEDFSCELLPGNLETDEPTRHFTPPVPGQETAQNQRFKPRVNFDDLRFGGGE
jgi:hypothetical protein